MYKMYTKITLLCFLIAALTVGAIAKEKATGAQLHMYGLVIEATAPQDDEEEGILSNKEIKIINLGPVINHEGVDYAPTVSADGKTLFYVSDKPGSITIGDDEDEFSHDFWAAKKKDRMDTIFMQPYNIDPGKKENNVGVNTSLNEGAASIAADRQSLYFTGCNRQDGLGSCDIYKSSIQGDKWGRPVNLGRNVNAKNFDSQPAISPDQSRLYFVSTREGPNSNGDDVSENFDIWYSDYDFDLEEWGKAKNLEAINTPGRDVSPFIAADGVTLFFASDGHEPNFGGQDFYVTRYNPADDSWSKPKNIGEPINTDGDEQFITLPASGDIIYFSSTREDLKGYQGSLDVFMAFVPSFFKAVNVTGTVVDECSGDFIPATITIKNPMTGQVYEEELDTDDPNFEKIITNDWYGDPKDDNKYINLEITATAEGYGSNTIVQRVDKPETTNKASEEGEVALEYEVKIPLGQKPILAAEVEKGEYVTDMMEKDPDSDVAKFDGLVMEEVLSWDLYPLLNYVFFDKGSSELPSRYITFEDQTWTESFTDTTIPGGTLDKYYHILNIYGFRLKRNPDVKITLVGTNDNVTDAEKGNKELSRNRAQTVYDYFKNVWNISEDRMTIEARNFPKTKSNPKDSLGIQENRRVEILADEWDVIKPVFEKDPKTFPQPPTMNWVMTNGIEQSIVKSRRIEVMKGDGEWNTLTEIGIDEQRYEWNWKNTDGKYPLNEETFKARLVVTSKSGAECISEPIEVPVMQVSSEQKVVQKGADSLYENYSLILFKFNSYDAGPLNDKIMNDYVYNRIQPTSVVDVIGHTDNVGLYKTNKRLSENRANTVYKGINRKTKRKYASLEKRGVGEDEPLYDNSLPEGRFYNRTVQVLIKTPVSDAEMN